MRKHSQQGFSLIEVMMVMAIFLVVTGAVFGLMNSIQVQYRNESQFMESFDAARMGMDLLIRDIHNAGYPSPYTFAGNLVGTPNDPTPAPLAAAGPWDDPMAAPVNVQRQFAIGFVGMQAGAVVSNCTVNGAVAGFNQCAVPNAWELVIETDLDPERPDPVTGVSQVEWVYYDLRWDAVTNTSTFYRTINPKVPGNDPTATPSQLPMVEMVLQNPGAAVAYPGNMPVFSYECEPSSVLVAGGNICFADHIKTVHINLRVRSKRQDLSRPVDPVTGDPVFRQITVQGAASRYYPSLPTRRW